MSPDDGTTPDQESGAEAFEQGDEAFGDASIADSGFLEAVEQDPSLDPALQVDEKELEEIGAQLDDPEAMVTLEGGIDDPDGLGGETARAAARRADTGGWDLDTPLTKDEEADDSSE